MEVELAPNDLCEIDDAVAEVTVKVALSGEAGGYDESLGDFVTGKESRSINSLAAAVPA